MKPPPPENQKSKKSPISTPLSSFEAYHEVKATPSLANPAPRDEQGRQTIFRVLSYSFDCHSHSLSNESFQTGGAKTAVIQSAAGNGFHGYLWLRWLLFVRSFARSFHSSFSTHQPSTSDCREPVRRWKNDPVSGSPLEKSPALREKIHRPA